MPYVNLNGLVVQDGEAAVSIFDYGLLYGQAVFETIRVREGRPLFIDQHALRLQLGADALGIPLNWTPQALAGRIRETVEANSLADARVRVTVTAGEGRGGPGAPPESGPNWFITAQPYRSISEEEYERGHRAVVTSIRRSSQSIVPRHKTTNLLENLLAQKQAREKGAEQGIILNEKRCITECAFSNIFFVAYGGLMTAALDCGLLPGVTRDAVIGIALKRGMRVDERWINAEEVWDAEEVFITNAIIGILPITAINGRPIRGGVPGKVTRTLTLAYEDLVRSWA
jgi:branched-subunit amino acid aminotransferase/4-amino-4-deoxychorismate lyase